MRLFKGGKPSSVAEPTRRAARLDGTSRPDFVYYANRRIDRNIPGKGNTTERSRSLLNAPVGAPKQSKNRRRGALSWGLIVLALLLLGRITMLSNTSKVVTLQADGTQTTDGAGTYQGAVDDILGSSILNRSKITIDTGSVAAELRRRHPEIESAVITVPLVSTRPTAYIAQSEKVFTLQQNASFYTLSSSGYITEAISGELKLPLVQDQTGEKVEVGKRLLSRAHVEFMRAVLYQFDQTDIKLTSFVLPANKAYEVNARLDGKPYAVRFNLEEDALQQSGAAIATIEQLGAAVPTAYVDVRVPGRVYYK